MGEEEVEFTLMSEDGGSNVTTIVGNATSSAPPPPPPPEPLSICPDPDKYPTIAEFNAALGTWASVLYVVSAVIVVILALQYGFLVGKFNKNVPNQRKVSERTILNATRIM